MKEIRPYLVIHSLLLGYPVILIEWQSLGHIIF
nr:MAG TPA: hypothetical protein [Crassvirales sp.]